MDDKQPDVAVGELLRAAIRNLRVLEEAWPDADLGSECGVIAESLERALSALPAEPKRAQRFNLMPLGMFPSDTGLWVRYNEHLAIVAALEKQLPIRPTPATQEQWLPGPGVPSD